MLKLKMTWRDQLQNIDDYSKIVLSKFNHRLGQEQNRPAVRGLVVTRFTSNPGVVSSIPRRTSLSDETLNRGPMYQCFTLGM